MAAATIDERLYNILRHHWGYESLRPLQAEAISSIMAGRDTLVVLPTGGGKSLCFQVPAVAMGGMALVVSPLISLMKDQVDALRANGVEAECLHSGMTAEEQREGRVRMARGGVRLLYISPERLALEGFQDWLERLAPSFVAIDEAHCISMWGHDFRPEYRQLAILRERFPRLPFHAFTATATREVQADISAQLGQRDPSIVVGSFDRPNLFYELRPRQEAAPQIVDFVRQRRGQSGIVYCLTRREVERMAERLRGAGIRALPYHAGMDSAARDEHQEAFRRDEVQVIVATVAFGMGIDKPDVRYVVHAAMPKSVENYQQECGRAGRDGMDAHCLMFHSAADAIAWERLAAGGGDPAMIRMTREKIAAMRNFCGTVRCRRVELLAHFGEEYPATSCGRCDNCLRGSLEAAESTVLAQKILSCIKRLGESRSAVYTAKVLVGTRDADISAAGHDQLSTHGLLANQSGATVERWIEELAAAGLAEREWRGGALRVTAAGWRVLRGEATTVLSRPAATARARAVPGESDDHDPELFEALRAWRMARARELGVPPYVVFGDRTLRELARIRPTSIDSLHQITGIGDRKHAEHGEPLMGVLLGWYAANPALATDQWGGMPAAPAPAPTPRRAAPPPAARTAMIDRAIAAGHDIDTLAEVLGRARSTTVGLIVDHLRAHGAADGCPWVTAAQLDELRRARAAAPGGRLRPIHEALGGRMDYDTIRIGLALLEHEDGG